MLYAIGYAIAGVFIYENMFCDNESKTTQSGNPALASRSMKEGASTVIYHIKSGEGEVSLPSCKLMAVELGPSPLTLTKLHYRSW